MYERIIKRLLDICFSGLGLIVLSPVMGVVSLMIVKDMGKPVIFKQQRPGKNEELFSIYKFRSMSNEKDENGELLSDAERVTKLGRFLRSTSLDELPELVNIFKGDMSIVGPRPLEVYYLPYYNEREKHRHDVLPGLTGLAQVNGRNSINWDEKFCYDLYYVEKLSFLLDLKIVVKTISQVLKREGIAVLGEGTEIDFVDFRNAQNERNKEI